MEILSYTPAQAAKILGVSPQMVRVSINQRAPGWETLPYYKTGRNIHIPKEGFWIWARGRTGATAKTEAICRRVKKR